MKKFLCSAIIIVLLGAVTALVLRFIVFGQTQPASQTAADKRTVVIVTEAERAFILGEMRTKLAGIQQILQAGLNQDMPAIVAAAEPLGMKGANNAPRGLMSKLPLAFKKLGLSSHRAFDQIALDGKDLGDVEYSLGQLNDVLGNCVACHAAFRLQTN
ncbi:MAG: hypothetical protein ABFS56_21055 [Pseudomonadota bacterium]